MEMIVKTTPLTEEALKSFSLRIAGDGTEKGLEKVIGTAVTVDENIPHAFADDDGKSIMGFPSVSEVGEALARNVLGPGSDCESLVTEVEDLMASLTKLLQKATEVSADRSED